MLNSLWWLERDLLPDPLIRWGIRRLLRRRRESEAQRAASGEGVARFAEELRRGPLAVHTKAANEQHYEVPTAFFAAVLGPRLKYSSGFWEEEATDLARAEESMLALTCARAQLRDGQDVLELGCGWGSLTLFMAERFPRSRITAVSNSRTQKQFIDEQARQRGLGNVRVLTEDMNHLAIAETFDRVVSVEMFEHMRNYEELLARVRRWLRDDGRLFVHIFCHRAFAYPFETDGNQDWMARYFFTGGIMPSYNLLAHFGRDLRVLESWPVNGCHYARTLEAWLANMDRQRDSLWPLFEQTYGRSQALRWWVYWRVFFLACAELFAYRGGSEWFVGHYLLDPVPGSLNPAAGN